MTQKRQREANTPAAQTIASEPDGRPESASEIGDHHPKDAKENEKWLKPLPSGELT